MVGERFLLATEYNLKLSLLTLVSIRILNLNNQSTSTTIDNQSFGKSDPAEPLPTTYIMRRPLITGTCQFVRNCYVFECCIQEFRRVKSVCLKKPRENVKFILVQHLCPDSVVLFFIFTRFNTTPVIQAKIILIWNCKSVKGD